MQKQTIVKVIVAAGFGLSLSANVAMAGVVAGEQMVSPVVAKIAAAFSAFADLSPESRDKTVEIAKRDWPEIQRQLQAIHAKRQEAKEILARPDYKRSDLEQVFADLRTDATKLQTEGQNAALDMADAITPDERVKLIKSLDIKR